MVNTSSIVDDLLLNEIQFGNAGAAIFIITYIGFYGLGIIIFFGQQLKEMQRQRFDLPASFLKTLWDVPSKNKLYEELADIERLKRIFRGYFVDHETYTTINHEELQAIVDERAYACALKYREKLRRLHLSHTDYYSDTVQHSSQTSNDTPEQYSKIMAVTQTSSFTRTNFHYSDYDEAADDDDNGHFLSISVV